MANSLIKTKIYVRGVAGRPFIAAQPARDVWEKRQVCGYKQTAEHLVPGRYEFLQDKTTGQFVAIYVPDKSGVNGVTLTTVTSMSFTCWQESVLVRYAATPGQTAVAAVPPRWDYKLGWDGGARSIMFVTGDANATFHARESVIGAICGLNVHEDPQVYSGLSIRFGFYLSRGYARVFERGQFKTPAFPYSEGTEFEVTRSEGVVTYYMGGSLVYTSADTSSGNEPLWLQAALYSGDDEIFNPKLNQITPLDDTTPVTGVLTLTIPPGRVAARKGEGAVLRLKLAQPRPVVSSGALAAPSFTLLSLSLPSLQPGIFGLVGAVGQLNLPLPSPALAGSDRDFGRVNFRLPVPYVFARTWPADELPAGNGRVILNSKATIQAIATLPTKAMRLNASGFVEPYAEVSLGDVTVSGSLLLGGSMAAVGEVTLPLAPMRAVLGGAISLLSGLDEVFSMSLSGGTTRYEGYEFNSYMRIGGKCYGANAEGLFLLEGDDDDGRPIAASFGFGQQDFGSPQLKTASYCYLGAAAGAMSLNVQALLNGKPAAYDYPARGHGQTMREVRFDLGRGLRSTYLTPTFSNIDGAPFEVDSVRFVINESNRRI